MAAQTTNTTTKTKAGDDLWLRSYFERRLAALDQDRTSYWPTWRQLATQFAPHRGQFLVSANDSRRGRRKDRRIIDNTAIIAARGLGAGMMAGMSSPARPWFRLRFADETMSGQDGVSNWLDECQKRILHVFAKSNLYNCLAQLYEEIGTFGTGVLWADEDDEDIIRGYTLSVGEYWLASSKRQSCDTLYRSLWWTVRKIVEEFGVDNVSPAVKSMYENGQLDTELELVHVIEPNPNAAPPADRRAAALWSGNIASRMPFRSVWFERGAGRSGHDGLLRVSGYPEFPVMAPRWSLAGSEVYGSGPGGVTLGDAQGLQVQQRQLHEAVEKSVKPTLVAPPSMKDQPISSIPGDVIHVAETNGQGIKAAFEVRLDLEHLRENILDTRMRIKDAMYINLFLMMANSDRREITAREVDERHEEKMLQLGPVLERLHDELLDPLVERVFNVMQRRGLLPPPPHGVNLASMQIEYISMLASAQKAASSGTIERVWAFAANIAAAKPEVMDRMDADGTIELYADMQSAPSQIIVPLEKANAVRAARAKAQQEQQMRADAASAVAGAKALSETQMGGGAGSALDRLTGTAA